MLENKPKKTGKNSDHWDETQRNPKGFGDWRNMRLGMVLRTLSSPVGYGSITRLALDRFELFVPLHQLWMGYMSELLGLGVPDASSSSHESKMPGASSMHAKLVKADFNGALLTGER
jgi:hypothetical protein